MCESSIKTCSYQQGVPEKKTVLPTVPESPAFALKNRVRVDKVEEVRTHLAAHSIDLLWKGLVTF